MREVESEKSRQELNDEQNDEDNPNGFFSTFIN